LHALRTRVYWAIDDILCAFVPLWLYEIVINIIKKRLCPTGKLLSWAYYSIDMKALRAIDDILCTFLLTQTATLQTNLPAGRQAHCHPVTRKKNLR